MPAIKHSSIRDLKDRINIYDVVAREVTLKKAGSGYKGLSPFTNERTPSFHISPDKGIYKCFSSGNAGDSIQFVMETQRLNFVEAVESLAKQFNIQLEYEDNGRPQEDRSLRQELLDIHEVAADFYHEQFLATNKDGEWIRDYWVNGRKFALEVANDFKIGLAPPNGIGLGHALAKRHFSRKALEACGLVYTSRGIDPNSMGYRFRGRLMIPIRDNQGRITAFTARQLDITPLDDNSRDAKYVNSPGTPIFDKSNLLFNLDRARMEVAEDKPFVMVEGQLDAIRCWSVGIKTAVAPQGTGITEAQLRLIKRYEPQLIMLLDGDTAGQKAALRMLPLALAQGVETVFIPLVDKEDPDDIFLEGGSAALDTLLERKMQPIPYACHTIAPNAAELTPQAKAKVARELFAIINHAESSAVKVEFVNQAAEQIGLEARATMEDFSRFAHGQQQTAARKAPPRQGENSAPTPEPKPTGTVYTLERDLLGLCLMEGEIGSQIAQVIDPEWIETTTPEGQLLNHVLNEILHDMWNGPDSLNEQLENAELRTLAATIHFDAPEQENPERLANEALKKLVGKFVSKKTKELKLEIGRKQATNDADVFSLLGELSALNQLRQNPPHVG